MKPDVVETTKEDYIEFETIFLQDLIDDLDHEELTVMLNYIAIHGTSTGVRAAIKSWRRDWLTLLRKKKG